MLATGVTTIGRAARAQSSATEISAQTGLIEGSGIRGGTAEIAGRAGSKTNAKRAHNHQSDSNALSLYSSDDELQRDGGVRS